MFDDEEITQNQFEDEVGYGKPPKAHQWKKGQSGNPEGKKKVSKDFGATFEKIANKVVTVLENGKTKKTTLIKLLINAPIAHGLKGNIKNAVQALLLLQEFQADGLYELEQTKPGTIYRDYHGRPKIAFEWFWSDELDAKLDSIRKYFEPDNEQERASR